MFYSHRVGCQTAGACGRSLSVRACSHVQEGEGSLPICPYLFIFLLLHPLQVAHPSTPSSYNPLYTYIYN